MSVRKRAATSVRSSQQANEIFISHAGTDETLARAIADFFTKAFPGKVNVRYSSSRRTRTGLAAGEEWRKWIHERVMACRVLVVAITPSSVLRPWVLWEAGAVWGLRRPDSDRIIIPLLLGISEDRIPDPLKAYTAIQGDDPEGVCRLFDEVLRAFPNVNRDAVVDDGVRRDGLIRELVKTVQGKLRRISPPAKAMLASLSKAQETLPRFFDLNAALLETLALELEALSEGRYTVCGISNVYRHDALAIGALAEGELYRATHPFEANPRALRNMTDPDAPFNSYIQAQIKAVKNRIRVERIYIADDPDDLGSKEREHLQKMVESGITTRIIPDRMIDQSPGQDGAERSKDFVLIGKRCVGIAQPRSGPMISSIYDVDPAGEPGRKYKVHDRFWKELLENAKPYKPDAAIILSQATFIANHATTAAVSGGVKPRVPAAGTAGAEASPGAADDRVPAFVLPTRVNLGGAPAQRLMVVLRTNGCFYDKDNTGCTMCDFKRHAIRGAGVTDEALMAQFENALAGAPDAIAQIDLLTLGSFLHDREVPPSFRDRVMTRIAELPRIRKVVVESRPSYVTTNRLRDLRRRLRPDQILELGVGVETSDDDLRQRVLRKGMTWEKLEGAVRTCAEAGIDFMGYLLIGTQTLTEGQAVDDAVHSAEDLAELCNRHGLRFRIAYEPVFITQGTELEQAFMREEYRLINLWSVVEVLERTSQLGTRFVGMSDEGLSGNRVPRGCDRCTESLREAIDTFNGDQDIAALRRLSCDCRAAPGPAPQFA